MVMGIRATDKKNFSSSLYKISEVGQNLKSEILDIAENIVRQKNKELDHAPHDREIFYHMRVHMLHEKTGHISLYDIGAVMDGNYY
ncbi:hypothetical protein CEXT_305751 [Caerostris extrusa]|uniref:Uncharacterized protein n=1 Tax=Caerostris extrusa TaxID=172846 RepID=A0AAV4XU29_CAEEX|nr:hypothetical protein CEXT_305751 [Caerostris extrusa]